MKQYLKRINPIIRNIADIVSFTDIKDSPYINEYSYLINLVKLINNDIGNNQDSLIKLEKLLLELEFEIKSYVGADKSEAFSDYNNTKKQIKRRVENINELLDQIVNPYFGRIVFKRNADNTFPANTITTYIGKHAYFDRDTGIALITDWRAPITDLYYSNSGPKSNVSFTSPAGIQNGDLIEKTQFEISMGRIHNVYNSQTGNAVADAFLLSQLSKKIGKKLSDIVATIQDQQNEIIRDTITSPIILQGVAGSGKTTILLHRIAYLLYNYKDEIQSGNSLVIAPNKMFIDYISDILPSLGVSSIEQATYLNWARKVLNWEDNYLLSAFPDDFEIIKYKGTFEFINKLENYLSNYEEELFEQISEKKRDIIRKRYFELKATQPDLSIYEALNLSIQYSFAQEQFKYKTTGDFFGDLENQKFKEKEIFKKLKNSFNPYKIYTEFIKSFNNSIKTKTLSYLRKEKNINKYKLEDLPAIIWIHLKIFGIKDYRKDYVAIDEAQDMSIFQIMTLIKIAKNHNVTIAGDIAQAIIPPYHIEDWTRLIASTKKILGTEIKYHQLDKCYRTTIEIIDFANSIIKDAFPKNYKLPEAVLRHGEQVNVVTTQGSINTQDFSKNDLLTLIDILNKEIKISAATIALICKDITMAENLFLILDPIKNKLSTKLYHYNQEFYNEGILVLPVEKAKGLEFDSVVIIDFNKETYSDSFTDKKLFYVAATRALHRLHILQKN